MRPTKEQLLIAVYKVMPAREIQRRLDSGQLAPIAADIARAELERRLAPAPGDANAPTEANSQDQTESGSAMTPVQMILGFSALGLLAYLVLPRGTYFLILVLFVLPSVAVAVGKLFPTLSMIAGGILSTTFIWLGAFLMHKGEFTPKGADYQPLGALLAFIFYFIISGVAAWIGAALIKGATHQGSWSELIDDEKPKGPGTD